MPGLRHPPDGCARYRPAGEVDAHPRARAVHAVQAVLGVERSPVQAEPPGGAAHDEDQRDGPALDLVAGGALRRTRKACYHCRIVVPGGGALWLADRTKVKKPRSW
jgi:hypothetical protein